MDTLLTGHTLFFLHMLLAALLGALIGIQRERSGKAAGPRTYGLVSLGAALFTTLSINAFGEAESSRVAAQIVTGIGFLGAGIIIHKQGGTVEGLTTAAGLWAVSAIGMAVGAGWIIEAVIVSIIIFLLLAVNHHKWIKKL